MKLPVKFLAIDLDHTLIEFGMGEISPRNYQTIRKLKATGTEVVLVTGRNFARSIMYAEKLQLNYHISFGGSVIYDLKRRHFLQMATFPKKTLEQLKNFILADHNLYAVFYVMDAKGKISSFTLNNPNEGFAFHAIKQDNFQPFHSGILQANVVRVGVFTAVKIALENAFQKISFIPGLKVNQNYNTVLEITPVQGDKGSATAKLVHHLGILPTQTAAIIDSLNDYALAKFVTYRIAVANAHPLIKKICQYHTAAFDQDGVAIAIEKWLL